MSAIQSPHGVTYDGEMAKEYIWRPALVLSGIEEYIKVLTGVKAKQQVIYATEVDKITVKDTGCDSVFGDKQITRTEKFWDPKPVEATIKQCYSDLYGTIHESQMRGGTDKYKLTGTEIEKILLRAVVPAAARDFQRMIFLSNTAIVAGNLTGGAGDVANYNQVDGFWKKIITAAVALLIPRYTIAENAATTTAGQQLGAGRGRAILSAVYYGSKLILKQAADKDKVFLVTRSIYENYSQELESNQALESNRVLLLNGNKTLSYQGIPLIIHDVVDTYLQSDFIFGAGANITITNPHRVILTTRNNFQVSVDTDTSNPIAFETWDEKKEKRWYARAMYELDDQIAFEELVSVAY